MSGSASTAWVVPFTLSENRWFMVARPPEPDTGGLVEAVGLGFRLFQRSHYGNSTRRVTDQIVASSQNLTSRHS
jgi:hypothetical protein